MEEKTNSVKNKSKLNIAIVTNNQLHHNYFAVELNKTCNVKCIIIPTGEEFSIKEKINQFGFILVLLKIISKIYNKFNKNSMNHLYKKTNKLYFEESKIEFNKIDNSKIHYIKTVNSDFAIELIKKNEIDIICFLGGDISKNNFISSAKIACLNLHSGISPFYNGAGSSAWTVADNRPNFAGVTLMKMNERIDGGNIISHFLPSIDQNDDAATLFMKGVIGSVELVKNEIQNYENGIYFDGLTQNKSFKYTKGIEWNIYHDLRLKLFHLSGRMKIYKREEKFFYYNSNTNKQFYFNEILSYILN
jgi:folate-dependent phosphoribosylglycinamide formyltransferase PurN